MDVYSSNGKLIKLDDHPIAQGGEGAVYSVLSPFPDCCVKIYHNGSEEKKEKVAFMIKNKPSQTKGSRYMLCWPTDIITNQKKEFMRIKG